MPTIALMNGHAFAGGLFLALHHDYRFQNPSKGFLCLNEVHFGAMLPAPMAGIVKTKVSNVAAVRSLITEGKRFNAQEALAQGITDGTGGLDEVLKFIEERSLTKLGQTGVYGALKEQTYREQLYLLDHHAESDSWRAELEDAKEKMAEERTKRVEAWSANNGKSKI